MKPEEFRHYRANEATVLAYRGLQEAYHGARRAWRQSLEAMTPEEREIAGRTTLSRTEDLCRRLFELPQGTPGAGYVVSVPEPDGETHESRALDTDYGRITVHKLQTGGDNVEYWPVYNPKEPGAIVAQSLRYDKKTPLEIINDDCELDTSESFHHLLPGAYNFDVASCVELRDILETMEYIAESFGVDGEDEDDAPDGEDDDGGAPDRSPLAPAPPDSEAAVSLEPEVEHDQEFEATPARIV